MGEDLGARITVLQAEMSATKRPGPNMSPYRPESNFTTIPDYGTRIAAQAALEAIALKGSEKQRRMAREAISAGMRDSELSDAHLESSPSMGCLFAVYGGVAAAAGVLIGIYKLGEWLFS